MCVCMRVCGVRAVCVCVCVCVCDAHACVQCTCSVCVCAVCECVFLVPLVRLAGFENTLLGYRSRHYRLVKDHLESMDTVMFGEWVSVCVCVCVCVCV